MTYPDTYSDTEHDRALLRLVHDMNADPWQTIGDALEHARRIAHEIRIQTLIGNDPIDLFGELGKWICAGQMALTKVQEQSK